MATSRVLSDCIKGEFHSKHMYALINHYWHIIIPGRCLFIQSSLVIHVGGPLSCPQQPPCKWTVLILTPCTAWRLALKINKTLHVCLLAGLYRHYDVMLA